MEFLKMLAAMLGLPETATEEDIKNAVEALQKKGTETEPVANSTILSMLSLKADAKTEDVTAKIQQLQNGGTGLAAELADLRKQFAKREAEEAVAVALKDGKISAAQKEWAMEYALKEPTGFQSFCEKATPVVPMGKTALGDPKVSGRKTEMDTVILKNLGLSKEDLEKYADKEV
ncbi:MAG: phage protease [Eisenbergiella porci]|uniref:phage protease n=1 Tax=Eisenbergiella porci TaxID=2652274 RepID=UPI002A74D678|nr:phage protease [Eisenbergiella porci]MDY2651047.1 phage protease [Eisenbergiella porci]